MAEGRVLLAQIRNDLEGYVGSRVRVRANKGRRRVVEREGTLERAYPNLFVIKLDEEHHGRRISYTYADILTEAVELTVVDNDGNKTLAYQVS